MSVLEGVGLRLRLAGRWVVDGVDVSVRSGEVVGVLGPNGAGKSSLFRMLAGLIRPSAGAVRLAGVDVTRDPLHRRARSGLGYVAQAPSVFGALTAEQNVVAALRAVRRPDADSVALLEAEGLGDRRGQRAETLSGGQLRRLELARCLALRPVVLLLDEPFSAVDPPHVHALQQRFRELARQGTAVLLTDHRVSEAFAICDRVILVDGGVVQFTGTPAEMAQNSHARDRYLGAGFVYDADAGGLQREP